VEDCVWTERMVAALVDGVKGSCWFSLIDKVYAPATLAAAWTKVEANKGAAGVDGQSIERFAARSEMYLAELASELRAKRSWGPLVRRTKGSFAEGVTHQPQAIRRVEIPKDNGRTRPLGIPTVKDRIVQTAMKLVIEPIFEAVPAYKLRLSAGTGLQGRVAGGGSVDPRRLRPRGGCRLAKLL